MCCVCGQPGPITRCHRSIPTLSVCTLNLFIDSTNAAILSTLPFCGVMRTVEGSGGSSHPTLIDPAAHKPITYGFEVSPCDEQVHSMCEQSTRGTRSQACPSRPTHTNNKLATHSSHCSNQARCQSVLGCVLSVYVDVWIMMTLFTQNTKTTPSAGFGVHFLSANKHLLSSEYLSSVATTHNCSQL